MSEKQIIVSCQAFTINIRSDDGRDTIKSMSEHAKSLVKEYFTNEDEPTCEPYTEIEAEANRPEYIY